MRLVPSELEGEHCKTSFRIYDADSDMRCDCRDLQLINRPCFRFGRHDRIPRLYRIQTHPPLLDYDGNTRQRGALAPLAYLERIAPLRRHPMDEKALMSFSCQINRNVL